MSAVSMPPAEVDEVARSPWHQDRGQNPEHGHDHGGPDALGVPRWDFSTNANACGPASWALEALRVADRTRYPDPSYQALREALAAHHQVETDRVVLAASASEFIRRMSLAVALQRPGARVLGPRPGYGDYARAALALGLAWQGLAPEVEVLTGRAERAGRAISSRPEAPAQLHWITQPSSPWGRVHPWPERPRAAVTVIDRAYAPLQISGPALGPAPDWAWQLWSPNKTLGLTGVRASYALAPAMDPPGDDTGLTTTALLRQLLALASSWPLGADGVALLWSWLDPALSPWLHTCHQTLLDWKDRQQRMLEALGWTVLPSHTPYGVAGWPSAFEGVAAQRQALQSLRRAGIKLRDTTPLGLPGHVRLSVQSPQAQQAWVRAWADLEDPRKR